MSRDTFELPRLQRWMQAVVVHPGDVEDAIASEHARAELAPERLGDVVLPSATLSAAERVGVYHGMYLLRMEEALAADLEAVPPEAWEAARLRPIATLRLLELEHAVLPHLTAYHRDQPPPAPRRRPTRVAVYRRQYSVLRLD